MHTAGLLLGLQMCALALLLFVNSKSPSFSVSAWYWIGLGLVVIWSGIYGYRLARCKWRRRQDAIDTAHAADTQREVFINSYTAGLQVGVVMLGSLIGHYFGLDVRVAIAVSLVSAIAPMLVVGMVTFLVLVRRFFPE